MFEHPLTQNPIKFWLLIIVTFMLLTLAWTNAIDTAAIEYVNNSLVDAGLIFATARGINAVISVLQGTEIDALFITITVGELLDPINDLIERFSAIMLAALAVLVVLKLMLEIVGNDAFNILLSVVAVIAIGALAFNRRDLYQIGAKLLVITIVLRFGLSFVAFATEIIDTNFLLDREKKQQQSMEIFLNELEELETAVGANPRFEKQIETLDDEVNSLNESMLERREASDVLEKELQGEEAKLKTLCYPLPVLACNSTFLTDEKGKRFKALTLKIDTLKNSIKSTEDRVDETNVKLKVLKGKRECLQKKTIGENCGIWNKIKDASTIDIRSKLNQLEEYTDTFVENTINLLASLILKSILLPIGFLFLVVALCRRVLRLSL